MSADHCVICGDVADIKMARLVEIDPQDGWRRFSTEMILSYCLAHDPQENYIDRLADDIFQEVNPLEVMPDDQVLLYRLYALLLLADGQYVTDQDVHNAWGVWQLGIDPTHRSIVPFDRLTAEVQALDKPYTAAIHAVARRRGDRG